jgi:hypothetical protein
VAGLLVLIGGGGWLVSWLFSSRGEEPLAYVPSDCQTVFGADVVSLLATPLGPHVKKLLESDAFIPGLAKFKQESGLTDDDVMDQLTVGIRTEGGKSSMTMVLKSAVPLDGTKFANASGAATAASLEGRQFFRLTGRGPNSLYQPRKNMVVLSDLPDGALGPIYKSAGHKSALSRDLTALAEKAAGHDLWAVVAKEAMTNAASPAAGMLGGMAGGPEAKQMMQSSKGLAMWADAEGDVVEFTTAVALADAEAAKKMTERSQQEAAKAKGNFAQQAIMFALPGAVKALVQELTDSAQYTTDDTLSLTTMRVKMATLEAAIGAAVNMIPQAPAQPQDPGMRRRGGRGPGG